MYAVEEYTKETEIPFRYILTAYDKRVIVNIIYEVLYKYRSPKETVPFVMQSMQYLNEVYTALDNFFTVNPGEYFIRLNTISPKDAWYQLCSETPIDSSSINPEILTSEDIRNDINLLKVTNAKDCIMVLCHSERIYSELKYIPHEHSILLLPWKNDILYDTETRCFIKNSKLVAFSQYYADLSNGYNTIDKDTHKNFFEEFYNNVIEYINILVQNIPYDDAVVDIYISAETNTIKMVEINPFDSNTDSVLFTWDEILDLCKNAQNPVFRYKINNHMVEYKN